MEKEVTPKTKYDSISGKTLKRKTHIFPKPLIPTKRLPEIIGGIFILVILLGFLQIPYDSMLNGNMDFSIQVGYPLVFLDFGFSKTTTFPLKISALLLDFLIYLILAYAIDILINLMLKNLEEETELETCPTVFKNQEKSLADKVTNKVFQKPEALLSPTPTQPANLPQPPIS